MPKIVQCPKCRARLKEPPEGTPLYRCGNCSTTLQASHATQEDLDARRRRSSVKRETSSVSDSSSGELCDSVTDEFTVTRNSNVSAPYKRKDTSTLAVTDEEKNSTDTVPEEVSHDERNPPVTSTYGQSPVPAQERTIEPYPHPVDTLEKGMKQLTAESVSGADYLQRRAVSEEIGADERWSSNSNRQHGNSILQEHRGQGVSRGNNTSASQNTRSGLGIGGAGASSLRTSHSFMNGSAAGGFQQPPQFRHSRSISSDTSGQNHLNFGGQRTNSNNTALKNPARGSSKLSWKARDDSDLADVAPSSDAMTTTTGEEKRMSFEEVKLPVSVKEATSVEYSEKNRKPLGSRRRSALDDRRAVSEAGGDYISGHRTSSEGSEKAFDMYEHPASVGDYEPSETSSTTMDDVDPSEGYVLRRHLEEIGQYSPPHEHGLIRQGSRPNASSGRSVFSEESSSYGSQTEMNSPDNNLDNARENAVGRRNSWDERISRMGSVAPSNPGLGRPMSVRQKSISHDYGNIPTERLHRGSSDPGGSYKDVEREREKLLINHAQPQAQLPKPSYQPQPGLNNRYMNSALAAQRTPRGPWSPVNPSSRPYYPDSLQAAQTRPPFPTRPGHTKQGHPPPLPPSGTLPHVICQHCEVLLSVPDNLPPPKSNVQKLRCGSCRKISIFSVPHAYSEESNELVVPFYSRTDPPAGNSLLVSSPDHHTELSSSSTSHEVTGRHGRIPLPRARSVGDDEKVAADHEVGERARSRKTDLSDVSRSHSSPDITSRNSVGVSGSNAPLYRSTRGLDPRSHVTDTMAVPQGIPQAGGNGETEDKRIQDGGLTSSDSEAEFAHRTTSVGGSPQISHNSSRSPPDPSSTEREDFTSSAVSTTGRGGMDPHEARGLRKSVKGMFGIRKSVLELAKTGRQSSGQFRRKVVVNGQAIPDHLVKKAEEQAGPIHPGSYWYDSQAGFWGVAGTYCLGIIPPFIEEFNYPLSKDCSSGKTGILVNGRELHQQDLRKLSQRGLPDAPGMSYRIEIDGRVIEEAMGSELRSLGRLAPSVEQKGRGTGMYVPAHP